MPRTPSTTPVRKPPRLPRGQLSRTRHTRSDRWPVLRRAAALHQRRSITVLRVSVGLVFGWFGALKLFPGASPAEEVAAAAMTRMTGGLLPRDVSLPLLGSTELCLGLALVTGLLLRPALLLLCAHLTGVFASLLVLPDVMWHHGIPTLESQYVLKNVVLVAACLAIAADDLTH
ncbi:DoxX family membrane protein [Streptomyces sp. NPDC005876]|uniref:DoxX family membrane protein n=1 Tax=Streptomyces sp. NPDC005876 TaxID=3157076 RepID=UPI00340BD998